MLRSVYKRFSFVISGRGVGDALLEFHLYEKGALGNFLGNGKEHSFIVIT